MSIAAIVLINNTAVMGLLIKRPTSQLTEQWWWGCQQKRQTCLVVDPIKQPKSQSGDDYSCLDVKEHYRAGGVANKGTEKW